MSPACPRRSGGRHPRPQETALFSLATILPLAAEDSESGFHAPTLADFFPPAVAFEGTPFEINRIMIVRFIAAAVSVLLIVLAARRAKLVPGRFQVVIEMVLDFCRRQIAVETLGEKLGNKYAPIITTIFFTIFFFNITGVVPFLNVAGTSVIGLPLIFALWVFFLYIGAAVKKLGPGGFLKGALFPAGVPKGGLYILLTPVEFLQVFLLRPATLTIRLFANMMAGHLLLALCFSRRRSSSSRPRTDEDPRRRDPHGWVRLLPARDLRGALQAYVFAILTAVYLQMVLEPDH